MKSGKQSKAEDTAGAIVSSLAPRQASRLGHIGGSRSDEFNVGLINQAAATLRPSDDNSQRDQHIAMTVAGLVGIAPREEIEGMVAAQLIAAHNAAMDCYQRAMAPGGSFESRRENLNQASRLSRTYAALLEALNRHRGKGQQKVTVEHVHVHSGGQAIVGLVEQEAVRGGSRSKDRANAKQIEHAPQPALRSAHQKPQPVPLSGDEERPLPHARRD